MEPDILEILFGSIDWRDAWVVAVPVGVIVVCGIAFKVHEDRQKHRKRRRRD